MGFPREGMTIVTTTLVKIVDTTVDTTSARINLIPSVNIRSVGIGTTIDDMLVKLESACWQY